MRKAPLLPVLLLVIAAIGWGAYWFFGATTTEKALTGWLSDRRAEGWTAEAAAINTAGLPNRFDTSFEGLKLADPDTGVGWSADLFQTLSLAYKPTHIIAIWPGEHVFSLPDQRLSVSADTFRGSFQVRPGLTFPVKTSTLEIDNAGVVSSKGWIATLTAGQLSMREAPAAAEADTYDLFVTANDLDPGEAFLPALRETAGLPRLIEALSANLIVRFDAPWDRFAIERARPQPRRIRVEALHARWGDLNLTAQGSLDVGADGEPMGSLDLVATNWREMVDIAVAAGAIDPALKQTVVGALDLVARLAGDPNSLDIKLSFREGRSWLGPVPIGPAPDMRLP